MTTPAVTSDTWIVALSSLELPTRVSECAGDPQWGRPVLIVCVDETTDKRLCAEFIPNRSDLSTFLSRTVALTGQIPSRLYLEYSLGRYLSHWALVGDLDVCPVHRGQRTLIRAERHLVGITRTLEHYLKSAGALHSVLTMAAINHHLNTVLDRESAWNGARTAARNQHFVDCYLGTFPPVSVDNDQSADATSSRLHDRNGGGFRSGFYLGSTAPQRTPPTQPPSPLRRGAGGEAT